MMAAAVSVFVTEPMQKRVCGVTGTPPSSTLVMPKPRAYLTSSPCTIAMAKPTVGVAAIRSAIWCSNASMLNTVGILSPVAYRPLRTAARSARAARSSRAASLVSATKS
jgi:hypothetical protein